MAENQSAMQEMDQGKKLTAGVKKPFHEVVAEKLLEQLKNGTAPWQRPWAPGEPSGMLPMNPVTGKRYKGINALHLMAQGFGDQRWMTYNQAAAAGAQVMKGERGTPIQYWKFNEEQNKLDAQGRPVLNKAGEPIKEIVALERPRVFFATVFNAAQIDGLPQVEKKSREKEWSSIERAEQILVASGANIRHSEQGRAFYSLASDSIHLPNKDMFPSADNYYATALHELGHWTGAESRLNRDMGHPFGSEAYAKEELRAEIASMILGDELGIGHDPGQHAAYVASWIKVLENEPMEIFRAAADAEKAHGFVMAFEQTQQQKQEQAAMEIKTVEQDYEVNAKLAREHEQKVRNDPQSSVDAKNAAKSARKIADAAALINDPTLSPGLVRDDGAIGKLSQPGLAPVPAVANPTQAEKTYLAVSFKEKEEAKALGARWDRAALSWYAPANVDLVPLAKWMKAPGEGTAQRETGDVPAVKVAAAAPVAAAVVVPAPESASPRVYLAVPYAERLEARRAGAEWDASAKSWYVASTAQAEKLQKWKVDSTKAEQMPALSPREEFADFLRGMDCDLNSKTKSGEMHPIMDGTKQRISVAGDKKNEFSGFYVAYLDGRPNGYIKNNRTGVEDKWKSMGQMLTPEEKAQMHAEAAQKLQARSEALQATHEKTASRLQGQLKNLPPINGENPYVLSKGISPQIGALTDQKNTTAYIAAYDVTGKQWSTQYINKDGTKRFAKDSTKEACFHIVGVPVGAVAELAKVPVIIIGEGYATASTIKDAVGFPVVSGFDSGNLLEVGKAIHQAFPDKPILFAGDDDAHLMATLGVNPGRQKAEAAAEAVGGKVIFPIFGPGERDANPKGLTDFNDLAMKSSLGPDAVARQLLAAIDRVLSVSQERTNMQSLSQEPDLAKKAKRVARI